MNRSRSRTEGTAPATLGSRTSKRRWRKPLAFVIVVGLGLLVVKMGSEIAILNNAREAKRLIDLGEFQSAESPLDQWLASKPNSGEAHFFAAKQAIGLQRFAQGVVELEAARKFGYPAEVLDREKGILFARIGRLQEAEPLLRKIFFSPSRVPQRDVDLDEALARCYIETFQLRAAEEVVKRWVVDAPDDARAYYWRAEIQRRKPDSEIEPLIADYEQALRLDPNHHLARIALAELYLKTHRNDDAKREFASHLEHYPDDLEAHLGLGRIAVEKGDDAEAIRHFDRGASIAPNDYRPFAERGKMEMERGRFADALSYFEKATAADASEPEIHYQKSLLLSWLGREEDAKREREETTRLREVKTKLDTLLTELRKSPNDQNLQYDAARWLMDHGHPVEGLRWAEKNFREHPRHVETNRLLADHYRKIGNHGLANFHQVQAEAQ